MSKLDDLKRTANATSKESLGIGVEPIHRDATRPADPRHDGVERVKAAVRIPLDRIIRDEHQPREEFTEDGLARLAESIKAKGQLQPARVRWDDAAERYILIAGERRWLAAQRAGLPWLECVVHDKPLAAAEILTLQLIENAMREDLTEMEEARAYRTLLETHGWSTHRLAQELTVTQPHIMRRIGLLRTDPKVQDMVESGTISPSVAYEISQNPDPVEQVKLATEAAEKGLKRDDLRERRKAAARRATTASAKGRGGAGKARKVTSRTFRTALGAKVTVERARGLDDGTIIAALADALETMKASAEGRDAA
jgi:ParB family transcriptional regulator, chromosome partitioning protein